MKRSRLKIDVAKGCGFCAGVRRAVDMAKRSADKHGQVTMLGDIVHNQTVIRRLNEEGVRVADSANELDTSSPVLLRAHGTTPGVESQLKERGLTLIDATCPLVKEIHKAVKALEEEGRTCIIVGDHGHDEVIGIAGQVKDAYVVSSPEEARKLPTMKKAGVVVQSTQTQENLQAVVSVLLPEILDLRVMNTICAPSRLNQREAERIARENDVVIVIGSRSSANTQRLFELVRRINPAAYLVSSADELEIDWFNVVQSVGITAGASTPDEVIQDVIHKIQNL